MARRQPTTEQLIREFARVLDAKHCCEKCDALTANPEDDYGEFICDDCLQNKAEAAYERHCEAFHDGGATQFHSLLDQQIESRRLK